MQTNRRRDSSRLSMIVWSVVVIMVTGCTAGGRPEASPSAQDDAEGSDRPIRSPLPIETVPPADPPVTGAVPGELMERILADAAERAGVDVAVVEVISSGLVTWTDGSLGCPEPDQLYTQALVDGYHVIIDAGGRELDYRATTTGGFRLCENPGGSLPGG